MGKIQQFRGAFIQTPLRLRLRLAVPKAFEGRAKGDAPKVTEPNLRFSAVSCENLRFSAVYCALQMLEFPGEGVNLQKAAVFCENLRFWALSVIVPSP